MKTSLFAAAAGGALLIAAGFAAPAMAQDTTVSGRVYYDVTNIDQTSNGTKAPSVNGTATDVKRFYLTVDHTFNNIWSADLTTDAQYNSTLGSTELFIKKAYVQGSFNPAFNIRLGSADLPWIPYVEDLYGYRYLEKTLIDGLGQGTSADWGVHAFGKFNDGLVSYAFSAVNGQGYKVAPGTGSAPRTNAIDVEGRVSLAYEGFNFGIGGYDGKLGKDVTGGAPVLHTATRFDAIAAYVKGPARVGVEYFKSSNYNGTIDGSSVAYINSTYTGDAQGTSVFASYKLTDQFGLFARWDQAQFHDHNPALAADIASPKETYYTAGVTYSPYKNVDFSLAYKHTKVDDGSLGTVDSTIGATAGSLAGTRDEVGLWGQFRW